MPDAHAPIAAEEYLHVGRLRVAHEPRRFVMTRLLSVAQCVDKKLRPHATRSGLARLQRRAACEQQRDHRVMPRDEGKVQGGHAKAVEHVFKCGTIEQKLDKRGIAANRGLHQGSLASIALKVEHAQAPRLAKDGSNAFQ